MVYVCSLPSTHVAKESDVEREIEGEREKQFRVDSKQDRKHGMDISLNWPRTRWVVIACLLSLAAVFGLYEMAKSLNNSTG